MPCILSIENTAEVSEKQLIEACKQHDRMAQKKLYERFSPMAMGVCRRYVKRSEDAEDILVEAMFKVLTNIEKFKGEGSFEGWVRRIVVNEALMFLRRQQHTTHIGEWVQNLEEAGSYNIAHELQAQDILHLLGKLPQGYRTVFNLYVIEGYKHREIAEILGISINTSKSQLILAKKRMQELLEKYNYPGIKELMVEEDAFLLEE